MRRPRIKPAWIIYLVFLACGLTAAALLLPGCGGKGNGEVADEETWGWSRISHDPSLFSTAGSDVVITDICAGGPGLVAVGFRHEVGAGEEDQLYRDKEDPGTGGTLEIWVSEDGREWSRLGADAFFEGSSPDLGEYAVNLRELMGIQASARIEVQKFTPPRICSGPSGMVISCCLNLWHSRDGRKWMQLPGGTSAFAPEPDAPHIYPVGIADVAEGGWGYVATGYLWNEQLGSLQACAWDSPDGKDWARSPADKLPSSMPSYVYSITSGGPGLVVVGSLPSPATTEGGAGSDLLDAQVWTADPDGLSWNAVPPDEEVFGGAENQEMVDVTEGGPGLVAVGHDGGLLADDSPPVRGAIWTSPDGAAWQRVGRDEGSLENTTLYGVTAVETDLVAVGKTIVVTDPKFNDSYFVASVWASEDGLSWGRTDMTRASEGPQADSCLYGVVPFQGGFVAVGYDTLDNGLLAGAIWVFSGY